MGRGGGVGGGGEIAMDGGQHGGLEGSIKSSGSSLTPPPAGVGGYICICIQKRGWGFEAPGFFGVEGLVWWATAQAPSHAPSRPERHATL